MHNRRCSAGGGAGKVVRDSRRKSTSQQSKGASRSKERVYSPDDEEEIQDTHRDLDRCSTLLDSLMQASAETRHSVPRSSGRPASKPSMSRAAVGDQSSTSRQPVASNGAHGRSQSSTRAPVRMAGAEKKTSSRGVPARSSRVVATPLRGVSSTSVKRTARSTGRRDAPASGGAAGRGRQPPPLAWTCDSDNDQVLLQQSATAHHSPAQLPAAKSAKKRSSSVPPPQRSSPPKREELASLSSSDANVAGVSVYESMDTTDLLQALLTRTIEAGDDDMQRMVFALCATVLKPYISGEGDPSREQLPGSHVNGQAADRDSGALAALREENDILRKKLQEALHKAQVAKSRLKEAEKSRSSVQDVHDRLTREQTLTTRLREQLAKKTSELEEMLVAHSTETVSLQTQLSNVERKANQPSPSPAVNLGSLLSSQLLQREHSADTSASSLRSHDPPAGHASAIEIPSALHSNLSHIRGPSFNSVLAGKADSTFEESSFMRLPTVTNLLASRRAESVISDTNTEGTIPASTISDSAGSGLTMDNLKAWNHANPQLSVTDQLATSQSYAIADTLTPSYLPQGSQAQAALTTMGSRGVALQDAPSLASAASTTISSALAKAVADVDLDSSVSSLSSCLPMSRVPKRTASVTGQKASVPTGAAVSCSDLTGSYADEDFQAEMAALDAGIQRLRQQLSSC